MEQLTTHIQTIRFGMHLFLIAIKLAMHIIQMISINGSKSNGCEWIVIEIAIKWLDDMCFIRKCIYKFMLGKIYTNKHIHIIVVFSDWYLVRLVFSPIGLFSIGLFLIGLFSIGVFSVNHVTVNLLWLYIGSILYFFIQMD